MTDVLREQLFHWLGYLGVVVYLGAYAGLQFGVLRGSGIWFTVLNMTAAALVLVSLTVAFNLASAMIRISWISLSLWGLGRRAWLKRRLQFSEAEEQLIRSIFPRMERIMVRRLFNAGVWLQTDPGYPLTEKGAPVNLLHAIAEGQAGVWVDGAAVGDVQAGFVGEMNVMAGGPASATVAMTTPGRVFAISGDQLRQLTARDADFSLSLEHALSADTGRKLHAANQRIGRETAQL